MFHDVTPASFHLAVLKFGLLQQSSFRSTAQGLGHTISARLMASKERKQVVSWRTFLVEIVPFSVVIIACFCITYPVHSKQDDPIEKK